MHVSDSTRLSYTFMSKEDVNLFHELDQDVEVMRYINGGRKSSMEDIVNVFLPRMEKYRNPAEGWGLWQVSLKDSGRYIGWILVRPMNFFSDMPEYDNLEIGWRFKRDAWGQGYATEAAKTIKSAICQLGHASSICAIADEANVASVGVMKKMGMTYIKTYLHSGPLGEQEVVYYQQNLRK